MGPGRVELPTYWLKASCTAIVLRARVSIHHLSIPDFVSFCRCFFAFLVGRPDLHVQSVSDQRMTSLSSFITALSISCLMCCSLG